MNKMFLILVIALTVLPSGFSSFPQIIRNSEETPYPLPSPSGREEIIQSPGFLDQIEMLNPQAGQSPVVAGIPPIIDIAVTESYEETPKVAYCGMNQYLAVYINNGDIYGQRILTDGSLRGSAFRINEGESDPFSFGRASQPDVACEWSHSRYIVVWTYDYNGDGLDFDLHAQGVIGIHQEHGSQLEGDMVYVAQSGFNETHPSIACNLVDYTCLVAYDYAGTGNGDIYGQLIQVESTNLSFPDSAFGIGEFGVAETKADLAWGVDDGFFVVVWQYLKDNLDPDPDQQTIIYAVVHDEYQTTDPQVHKGGTYFLGVAGQQLDPAIAYNPRDNVFLVTLTAILDSGNSLILGRYMNGDGTEVPYPNWGLGLGFSSSVAWNGGAEAFASSWGGSQFAVAYITYSSTEGYDLMATGVGGTTDTFDSYYTEPRSLDHVGNMPGWSLDSPDICGTSDTGRYLTAWQDNLGGINPNEDVLGILLAPYVLYLPVIKKQ